LRTLFLTILICLSLSAVEAFAADVLVLQSLRVKPFEEALRGFRSVCKAESKTVVVADAEGTDMGILVREERPELILAIGADALQKVKRVRNIPIIYLMVLNPEKITGESKNFVGINMNIPPQKYLNLMENLNPKKLKVGILYDPKNTGTFVKRILQTAGSMGIEINAMEIHSPKEVPEKFTRMKSTFNVFWMLPDSTVVTPETVEFLLLSTLENRIPVITFAGKYVEDGALVSLGIDDYDLGKQAGEMANNILHGAAIPELSEADARKSVMKFNSKVAKELGIDLHTIEASKFSN
jgi:putative tryptophan/tyrosine transport system substrate-binding protein